MSILTPLLKDAAISGILALGLKTKPQTMAGLAFYAVTALLAIVGTGFLIHAAYMALQMSFPPVEAAFLMSAIIFTLAAVSWIAGYFLTRAYKRRRSAQWTSEVSETVHTVLGVLEEEFETPIRENPKAAVLIAALGGLFAGTRLR